MRIFIVFLFVFFQTSFCSYADESKAVFSKHRIIFLKWGSGKAEAGRYQDDEYGNYYGPCSLGLDGKGNIYILDTQNQRVLIFSVKGELLKQIEAGPDASEMIVDWDGNLFLPVKDVSGKSRLDDVVQIGVDGKITNYPVAWSGQIYNGVIDDPTGKQAVTFKAPDDESSKKFPVYLVPNMDYERDFVNKKIIIKTDKLKSRIPGVSGTEIKVDLEAFASDILGVDDAGDVYELSRFYVDKIGGKISSESVFVFSLKGDLLTEIPVEVDAYEDLSALFKIDNQGNLYELCASDKGASVYRWSRH